MYRKWHGNEPIDFRRASLCSRIAFRSLSLCSLSSFSLAAAIADEALKSSKGLAVSSALESGGRAGVSRSINKPSFSWPFPSFCCEPRAGVCLRVSSKLGMFWTGETGTVGLRMPLTGNAVVDLRRLPLEFCSASRPPGPKLLLRDFLSFPAVFAVLPGGWIAPMSVVEFSLSMVDVSLDRGTWAIERRDRGRTDPAESPLDAMVKMRGA